MFDDAIKKNAVEKSLKAVDIAKLVAGLAVSRTMIK